MVHPLPWAGGARCWAAALRALIRCARTARQALPAFCRRWVMLALTTQDTDPGVVWKCGRTEFASVALHLMQATNTFRVPGPFLRLKSARQGCRGRFGAWIWRAHVAVDNLGSGRTPPRVAVLVWRLGRAPNTLRRSIWGLRRPRQALLCPFWALGIPPHVFLCSIQGLGNGATVTPLVLEPRNTARDVAVVKLGLERCRNGCRACFGPWERRGRGFLEARAPSRGNALEEAVELEVADGAEDEETPT